MTDPVVPPVTPDPPPAVPDPPAPKVETKEDVHKKLTDYLKIWGGEQNIPMNSAYWELLNKYRGM